MKSVAQGMGLQYTQFQQREGEDNKGVPRRDWNTLLKSVENSFVLPSL